MVLCSQSAAAWQRNDVCIPDLYGIAEVGTREVPANATLLFHFLYMRYGKVRYCTDQSQNSRVEVSNTFSHSGNN